MNKMFAVLSLGSAEITAAAAEWGKAGDLSVKALLTSPSKGITGCAVTDISDASDSISVAVKKLSGQTGRRIYKIYAVISSPSAELMSSSGSILLSKYGREIYPGDINKCIGIGSIIKPPAGKETLHAIVRSFLVDSVTGIKDPLGLEGVKMGVSMDMIVIDSSVVRNIEKCISFAGFNVGRIILTGIANSYRVITEEHAPRGICLVNICGGLVEAEIFSRGALMACRVVPLELERRGTGEGDAGTGGIVELSMRLRSLPGWETVSEIMITGLSGLNENIAEELKEITGRPVTHGLCISRSLEHLPADRARYISCLGAMDYLQNEGRLKHVGGNSVKRVFHRILGFMDEYF